MLQPSNPERMSSKELLRELIADTELLVQRQVTLAKLEAKTQVRQALHMVKLLAAGAGVGYAGLVVLLVSAALGLGHAIGAPWAGALIVGGVLVTFAAVLGAIGWARRVRQPLPRSTKEVEREITWAKHRATT